MAKNNEFFKKLLAILFSKEGGFFEVAGSQDNNLVLAKILEILTNKRGELKISQHEVEALAKTLLPDIIDFLNSDEGKKEFAEWQKQKVLEREVEKIAKKKIS